MAIRMRPAAYGRAMPMPESAPSSPRPRLLQPGPRPTTTAAPGARHGSTSTGRPPGTGPGSTATRSIRRHRRRPRDPVGPRPRGILAAWLENLPYFSRDHRSWRWTCRASVLRDAGGGDLDRALRAVDCRLLDGSGSGRPRWWATRWADSWAWSWRCAPPSWWSGWCSSRRARCSGRGTGARSRCSARAATEHGGAGAGARDRRRSRRARGCASGRWRAVASVTGS